ncbi:MULTISPECIES: hypothetical protein [Bacillus cereus group]|uniref:hypothetical protein n=1 Tax=Bacillus cereus group TaxID=86661 RepID=UPI0022E36B04|nr:MULTISPECIES: hypothetical protein [unclassified Bacillus cereus group]MDA2665145.1 hypothetical protein [Bacillus cereus group sp. Bc032]MDA2675900.1 hypothetical protein [Bacillus cereus group sp. Bc031]MDA2681383.1 hypothetical protein [Bacillus cereus group sp. Bc029]MDA2686839.1 hypothetical protein [Bacillus cereus group sp. Bc030]MDA2742359.1 hypothetical protein [Bacillus cereus group sp. Bc011]
MKEIEELKDRLRNEMVTRMDDSDIVDILTVLQRVEEEIDDWKQSHDKVARVLEKSERDHKETMDLLHDTSKKVRVKTKSKMEGVIRCSQYECEQFKRKAKKLKEEKNELLEQLALCRELLLPLMENHNDYEELLASTVSDPLQISYLCERVAAEFNASN